MNWGSLWPIPMLGPTTYIAFLARLRSPWSSPSFVPMGISWDRSTSWKTSARVPWVLDLPWQIFFSAGEICKAETKPLQREAPRNHGWTVNRISRYLGHFGTIFVDSDELSGMRQADWYGPQQVGSWYQVRASAGHVCLVKGVANGIMVSWDFISHVNPFFTGDIPKISYWGTRNGLIW